LARSEVAVAPPTRGNDGVERYGRAARRYHTAVYGSLLLAAGTGWWLLSGREGVASPLARALGQSDAALHKLFGWWLTGVVLLGACLGWRATRTFVAETMRAERGDLRWFLRWPGSAFTGRFAPHDGHFDPGQRVFNVLVCGGVALLVATGVGLVTLHGGAAFVWLLRLHRWATYVVVAIVAGHILLALGVLPGYRGVWRAMHWRGRLDARVARRLWPGWFERRDRAA
jgi:cytochrome b subunit of formate dehydrogenase